MRVKLMSRGLIFETPKKQHKMTWSMHISWLFIKSGLNCMWQRHSNKPDSRDRTLEMFRIAKEEIEVK